jgi:hypothetical protein
LTVARVALPSKNVMLPVGSSGRSCDGDTVAVKLTLEPATAGLLEETRFTLVRIDALDSTTSTSTVDVDLA